MKKHVRTYLNHFGFEEFNPCEVCGARAVDIHHIECRGMGGSKVKDDINNLMGLCRECHIRYGDKKKWIEFLKDVHEIFIKTNH